MEGSDAEVLPLVVLDGMDMLHEGSLDSFVRGVIQAIQNPQEVTKVTGNSHLLRDYMIRDSVLFKKNFDPTEWPYLSVIPRQLWLNMSQAMPDDPTARYLGFACTFHKVCRHFF